jgi:hypothetical protein
MNIIKHPMLQFVVGFFLSGYGIFQRTGNAAIDFFWLVMAVIGFALLINGSRKQFKK